MSLFGDRLNKHLLQRPFDSNLHVDGNRLATFLNYVSNVCAVYYYVSSLLNFIFIERWARCFQKIRHWKSCGDLFKLRKYMYLFTADWRHWWPSPGIHSPSFHSGFMGISKSSGSMLDLDWLTFIDTSDSVALIHLQCVVIIFKFTIKN